MIRETELSLFVPSPELIVRLASGDRPLGVRAGPPRIKAIRETFFDTDDHALRRRSMSCVLRQVEGEEPAVVVTLGETPDAEGITSRSRLSAAAVGAGVFETLRGDSEPAIQIKKYVEPGKLRPKIALDIHRLGRVYRGGLLLKPLLLLFFDRITVQAGDTSTVFHELSIRRRREGGPLIRDLAKQLRDEYHLFPDGLTRIQRAYRLLAVQKKEKSPELSPYGLSLALAVFLDGKIGLLRRGEEFHIPTFRGSGEDAARALASDLTGNPDLPLLRLGTTEPRPGRAVAELWTISDPGSSSNPPNGRSRLTWFPWGTLVAHAGRKDLSDPTLVSSLLLLTRRKLLGQIPWLNGSSPSAVIEAPDSPVAETEEPGLSTTPELKRVEGLLPILGIAEDRDRSLEARLVAASKLSEELNRVFFQDVTRAKGAILSEESDEGEEARVQLLDLFSIRIRGIVDSLYRCFTEDLSPGLEASGIHFRTWAGLMAADREAILQVLSRDHLPSMQIASEWGPSFVPDMPMAGCAVGIFSRVPQADGTRLFHIVLGKDPPAFIAVPGSTTVLPLDEVIRGYFYTQIPELELADSHMFRFTTGAALVREPQPETGVPGEDGWGPEEVHENLAGTEAVASAPRLRETRQSVVVRILASRRMPESYQTQLLRALERQAGRRNPLIGWSDLYPVTGPLDLSGIHKLLDLADDPRG